MIRGIQVVQQHLQTVLEPVNNDYLQGSLVDPNSSWLDYIESMTKLEQRSQYIIRYTKNQRDV